MHQIRVNQSPIFIHAPRSRVSWSSSLCWSVSGVCMCAIFVFQRGQSVQVQSPYLRHELYYCTFLLPWLSFYLIGLLVGQLGWPAPLRVPSVGIPVPYPMCHGPPSILNRVDQSPLVKWLFQLLLEVASTQTMLKPKVYTQKRGIYPNIYNPDSLCSQHTTHEKTFHILVLYDVSPMIPI